MPARVNKGFFTKVRIARELLREQAEEILKEYLDVMRLAKEQGEYETAAKMLQWLIEHMPADEDGERVVDVGIDKKVEQVQQGPVGPAIQIGIQVGGAGGQKKIAVSKPKPKAIEGEVLK